MTTVASEPKQSPERIQIGTHFLREEGIAALIALIALSIFSLVSFYMAFGAKTELRISDNFESEVQALLAAKAGLNHARELIRGPKYNDLLLGPDGTYTNTSAYLTYARGFSFRNPLAWATARSLDLYNPGGAVSSIADDGLINTGRFNTTNGTVLIPLTGIAETAPNPYGTGTITTGRYFVKASDNNGEASELAADGTNNPFVDGDSIIILRSMGVAQTIHQVAGGIIRRNSLAAVEARFRLRHTFDLDAPFVVEGNDIAPARNALFDGNAFRIDGGASNPGIATIDTDGSDGTETLKNRLTGAVSRLQRNNIIGMGTMPSISDITSSMSATADKALLMDPGYLYRFVHSVVPAIPPDIVALGDTHWDADTAPYLGNYDWNKPACDPSQDPKVVYVDGDLTVQGNVSGGGLLVITGAFNGGGTFTWNGLVLVIGEGNVDLSGLNLGIHGGMYVTKIVESGATYAFGTPLVTLAGNSDMVIDSEAISMGVRQIPAIQLSYREIHSMIDP